MMPSFGFEAVHLDQQLVERLLALVVAAAEAGAAMAADRVDFVDEDDARRVLLRLLEHVAHAARADADEHLDEVGARDGEERNVGLAGDRAREQRLAGAGRTDQQHAARNAAAESLELARVAQELDDLLQVELGLVDAGDVLERHAAMRLGQQLGAALAKAERLAARALHLPRQKDPHADQGDEGQPGNEQLHEPGHVVLRRARRDAHALVVEALHQRGITRRVGIERAPVRERAMDVRPLDHHIAHAALVNLVEQLREGDVRRNRTLTWILEYREEREQQQNDDHPEGEVSQIGVHFCLSGARLGLRNSANSARRFRDRTHYRSHYVGTMPPYAKRKGKIFKKCGSFTILPLSACGGALDYDPLARKGDHRARKRAAKPRHTG